VDLSSALRGKSSNALSVLVSSEQVSFQWPNSSAWATRSLRTVLGRKHWFRSIVLCGLLDELTTHLWTFSSLM